MLPAHLAENIRQQVLYYLQSTFDFHDKGVERAFERFIEDPETGVFKGPWVHLRRPFRPAPPEIALPFDIFVPFQPFLHQWRAWERLSSRDHQPQPTVITTGTGSGKTECFLYPILDHCRRAWQQGQKGIKAVILYPMNVLAADQEKRFARVIWDDPVLKASGIRVGNYTGRYDPADPGASAGSGTTAMGPGFGISNHAAQQEHPPDILLTNYKMLDFLLMRPQDQNLWRFNEPGVLRYLVLDELHTYHGAQGADVACLIRRLKERLAIPRGELCVIGTSATLDSREQRPDAQHDTLIDAMETSNDRLARFAETLFEESIPPEAVIGEDRLRVEEIVHGDVLDVVLPDAQDCEPQEGEDALAYARRQAALWNAPRDMRALDSNGEAADEAHTAWTAALGDWLKRVPLFRQLLTLFEQAEYAREDPLSWTELVERLARAELALGAITSAEDRQRLLASFLALVAYAQEQPCETVPAQQQPVPLAPMQVQLWIRELRRLGRVVDEVPIFVWLDEPPSGVNCLPAFHCSECGEAGWVARHDPSKDSLIRARGVDGIQLLSEARKIYQDWFGRGGDKSQYIVIISPWIDADVQADAASGVQLTTPVIHDYLCPASLVLRTGPGPCPLTGDSRRFRVKVSRQFRQLPNGVVVGDQRCPRCESKEGIFFIGSQAATLASVAIDEMFGSLLNDDPKLLAFTDSVQDASHRAGFFTARTYHFTFRTALQHVIDASGEEGLPLREVGPRLLGYWSQPRPGQRGTMREAMATLMMHRNLLKQFGKLPVRVQNRMADFIERFQSNPADPALHLHPLRGTMVDPKVRGADLPDGYRAIIIAPERGDTYLLVHIDTHDEAYAWARNKRFEVHEMTGVFQIFNAAEVNAVVEDPRRGDRATHDYLLVQLSDDELYRAGVPRPLIPAVRGIRSDIELEALAAYLPPDCRDVLYGIAAGMDLDEALEEMLGLAAATVEQPAVETPGDFTHIQRAPNFDLVLVEGEAALKQILEGPLEEWRIFLHPYQRKLVTWETRGPMSITGAAGTGKTVALMHRSVELARRSKDANARTLVTTPCV